MFDITFDAIVVLLWPHVTKPIVNEDPFLHCYYAVIDEGGKCPRLTVRLLFLRSSSHIGDNVTALFFKHADDPHGSLHAHGTRAHCIGRAQVDGQTFIVELMSLTVNSWTHA